MADLISTLHYDRVTKISSLTLSYDSTIVTSFTYTNSTGIVVSPAINSDVIIDYQNGRHTLNDIYNWVHHVKSTFNCCTSNNVLPLHKTEYEIKANEITLTVKNSNNDVLLKVEFTSPAKEIRVKPRVALNMNYSDFVYWLKLLTDFYTLIARRGY